MLLARFCAVCQSQPVLLWSPEGQVLIMDSSTLAESQARSSFLPAAKARATKSADALQLPQL